MKKWIPNTTTILLLIVLGFTGSVWWNLQGLRAGIQTVIEQNEVVMNSVTETVTCDSSKVVTITTVQEANEDDDAFRTRHAAKVLEFKENY